jgi:hypothetical protein
MPTFPQLLSGALSQYPLTARRIVRTVVNDLGDGRQFKYADQRRARAEWDFRLTALAPAEWNAIEELYAEAEGRLREFTFLDPLDNLLRHSEDLSQTVWQLDPLLAATANIADPWSSERATRLTNSATVPRELKQTIAAPGGFVYCLSAYVRSSQTFEVRLRVNAGPSFADRFITTTANWQHISLLASLDNGEPGVTASLSLPPGMSLDVAGLQLEAQPGASSYKKTGAAGGLYTSARFASDRLLQLTTDVDQHETVIRITAPWER